MRAGRGVDSFVRRGVPPPIAPHRHHAHTLTGTLLFRGKVTLLPCRNRGDSRVEVLLHSFLYKEKGAKHGGVLRTDSALLWARPLVLPIRYHWGRVTHPFSLGLFSVRGFVCTGVFPSPSRVIPLPLLGLLSSGRLGMHSTSTCVGRRILVYICLFVLYLCSECVLRMFSGSNLRWSGE